MEKYRNTEMENKEFAEKNAGKYFLYNGLKVRVVGYNSVGIPIIVTLPGGTKSKGWSSAVLDRWDILVVSTRASKFWYVDIEELK